MSNSSDKDNSCNNPFPESEANAESFIFGLAAYRL